MNTHHALGGKNRSIKIREAYASNPNLCKNCEQPILPKDGTPLTETKKKQFCNSTCAGQFSGKNRLVTYLCSCGAPKLKKSKTCLKCKPPRQSQILTRTKGDLFSTRKNWQSARSTILQVSKHIFLQSGLPKRCRKCGYDHHIEVAHIKAVKDFEVTATLREICDISNLLPLCRNHHWEQENGLLDVKALVTGARV